MSRRLTRGFPLALVILLLAALTARAATLTVNGTADNSPPNTSDGICSLREAITAINNGANFGDCSGTGFGTADTINFNISGTGVHTIALAASLPAIVKPMTINGFSQTGSSANTNGPGLGSNAVLLIQLDGTGVGNGADTGVLTVSTGGGGTTIKGLNIVNYVVNGIALVNSAGSNTVAGNYIGVNAAGTVAATLAFPGAGIEIRAIGGTESGDVIGGTTPAARNVIAGSNGSGQIQFPAGTQTNHQVLGNFIGTNAAGNTSLSISANGCGAGINIADSTTSVSIGDGTAAGRNLISGNCARGINLVNAGINNITIAGNFIGTDVTGTAALGNRGEAVEIFNAGTTTITGNVISGAVNTNSNGEGIDIGGGTGAIAIQGNKIGTDVTGTLNVGNQGIGINITNRSGVAIGGTAAGQGNVIAFNGCCQLGGQPGILINSGTGNAILGNSILSNNKLGIDLAPVGVTPNDNCDTDTGANNLQNFPIITAASIGGGNVTISGTLNSTPSTTFRVEFFANAVCDPSGNGQGQTFLGSANVTTDSSCNVSFGPLVFAAPVGQPVITATATDPNGNTSEFSACLGAVQPTTTPTNTPTATPTNTPTSTPTSTPTGTATGTPTNTPTATPTSTPTRTPTITPSATPVGSPTNTPTVGPAPAVVPTLSLPMLAILALVLAGAGWLASRRA